MPNFLKKNIVSKLLFWHFVEMPDNLKKAFVNFLRFGWRFFSVGFLLKTLFSHWRHYKEDYARGFNPKQYFEVFVGNLLSRVLGALVRLATIVLGLVVEALVFLVGIVGLLIWLCLPLFLAAGFVWGFWLLF